MAKRKTFEQACAQFVNRFTMDHVPAWARQARPDGTFYAPQWRSDREWYNNTTFPGEPGLHGNSRHCRSAYPPMPLGTSLVKPYTRQPKIFV
jgi:hypothetical protein